MVEITISHPSDRHPHFQVFASREGEDDRYTFGLREFAADDRAGAEAAARAMIYKFRADRFRRVAV
jgi:hypothetical protein